MATGREAAAMHLAKASELLDRAESLAETGAGQERGAVLVAIAERHIKIAEILRST